MKEWLYENKRVEVVVHKVLGHNILRFSIHAHTSVEDVLALYHAVSDYLSQFSACQVKV